jgi:hypothetical protein
LRLVGWRVAVQDKTLMNLNIQLIAMPGYICAVLFINVLRKKHLQMAGFAGKSVRVPGGRKPFSEIKALLSRCRTLTLLWCRQARRSSLPSWRASRRSFGATPSFSSCSTA